MEKPNFKHMCLMYIQQLTNFPYIEKDFDALTDYQFLCKVVAYLNKIITNENKQNETITALYNAFVELKDYVDNYDYQEEINKKLDEMTEDGTLENIINNYLNITKVYDTINEMIEDKETFVDGMNIKCLGYESINDGKGGLFKISSTGEDYSIDLQNGLYANYVNYYLDNYYDEITYEKKRYYDTDCYITTIPLNDKFGNQIKPYVAKNTPKTPTEYARDNFTSLTINASSFITDMVDASLSGVPIMIGNSVVLNNHPMISEGVSDNMLYIGIKEDRSIQDFQVNNTNLETLQNNGCINVFNCYYKLIDDGSLLDLSNVLVRGSNSIVTTPHPRQCLGIKEDKTIIILTCDGRLGDNVGLTSAETQLILREYGCYNAWNIDGGGSSSTTIKGSKINRNIDDNGTSDRLIPYTLNFKHSIPSIDLSKIYSFIGKTKLDILNQISPNSVNYQNLTSLDLNELIGTPIIGYGNNLSNTPLEPTTTAGYFINIPHSGSSNPEFKQLYNLQFFFRRDINDGFIRRQINGVFQPWCKINGEIVDLYNSGGNILLSTTGTFEKLPFKLVHNLIVQGNSEDMTDDRYLSFKVNRTGYFTVTGYINLVPKTADGNRYMRITRNGTNIDTMRFYEIVDHADVLYFDVLVNNEDINNVYALELSGQQEDAIIRMRVNVTTK